MFTSFKRSLFAGLMALCAATATTAEADTLALVGPEFAPLYIKNGDGSHTGSLVSLAEKISGAAGFTNKVELMPVKRMIQALKNGSSDISILVKQSALTEDDVWMSEQPVSVLELNLYGVGAKPAFTAIDDIKGTDLIVMLGYSYGGVRAKLDQVTPPIKFLEARSQDLALKQLEAKRAPMALLYDANVAAGLETLGRPIDGLTHNTLVSVPLYLYQSRKADGAEAKIERLKKVVAQFAR